MDKTLDYTSLASAHYDGIAASYKPIRASLPTTIRCARLPVSRRHERRAYWAGRAWELGCMPTHQQLLDAVVVVPRPRRAGKAVQ